jgi:hypothetical protein
MQHGDLDKTKVLKTKIVSISDVRKPNSKSVLKSSSIVLPHYILWCALLLSRYYVYPSLNISRSSLYIFCELDCLLREISLNSLTLVRPIL